MQDVIVLELAEGGSLADRLKRKPPINLTERNMVGLASGLRHCHQHGVVHRDVKPPNILFDGQGNAKLADFDLAQKIQVQEQQQPLEHGTSGYLAPETADGNHYLASKADVWALGATFYEMVAGEPLCHLEARGPTGHELAKRLKACWLTCHQTCVR